MKKYYLLTPGPTPVPPPVALDSALPILHHRTKEFSDIFVRVLDGLQYTFQTKNDVFVLTSSGTGGMESAVVNLISPGDKVLVASCGAFGDRWIKILTAYGIVPEVIKQTWGKPVDPTEIENVLRKIPEIKVVYTTHTETSTGVVNDLKSIGTIVASRENTILVVDAISGLVGQELRTDEWNLDVVVSGSQKGLMNPPGLAFVSVSSKAWSLVEQAKLPRFYWDYRAMKKMIPKKQTPFTPGVSLIVGLHRAIQMIKDYGLENLWARYEKFAIATRTGMNALGLDLFVKDRPCNVLTAVSSPAGFDSEKLVNKLREEYGVSIAEGQQDLKGKIFRLAHMGFMDEGDILVGISAVERGLKELGLSINLGTGVSAAEKVLFA